MPDMKVLAAVVLASIMGICSACGTAEDQAEMEAPARPGELPPGYEQPGYEQPGYEQPGLGQPGEPFQPQAPEGLPEGRQDPTDPFDDSPQTQDQQERPRTP